MWETLAQVLKVDHVTVLSTDEDQRAAEREQWDDGTNFLAVAPGVIMGYDRNVATNTMLRRPASKSSPLMAANWAGAAWPRCMTCPIEKRPSVMSKQKYLKDLKGRSLLKDTDLSEGEFLALVDLAGSPAPGEVDGHWKKKQLKAGISR